MPAFKERFALFSIRKKVVLAFIIGCIAVALSWVIVRVSFREMLDTVKSSTAPHEKLRLVNSLFQAVSRLDQAQRSQAIRNPGLPYESFLKESQTLLKLIDTLRAYSRDNPEQLLRLDSMEDILHRKDELFIRYLRMRADFMYNKTLSKRINDLSDYIAVMGSQRDSNVVTTEHRTTTTTITDNPDTAEKKTGAEAFFRRLFGRKKADRDKAQPRKSVTEVLNVHVDTLAVAQRDSMIRGIESAMQGIEKDQHYKGMKLVSREMALNNSSSLLIAQLLSMIRKLEAEEIGILSRNNAKATEVVNSSMLRTGIIMLLFLAITGILVFLILADISKSNLYRARLLEAKEEAERLSAVKQRFLANMSHEIRTPLQSIIGFSEQIRKEEKPEQESLDAIYHSSGHLLQIVNEVLDYSRIVSGKFSFEKQNFSMRQLLTEVAKTMEMQALKKNIGFACELPAEEMLYSGDAFRLRQILYNLLGNAIKFTEKGRVTLKAEAHPFPKKTEFIFRIADTGIGMSEEEKKRVFTIFEQADTTIQRTFGGTGLGLSIVKSLVEAQNGSIDLQSTPGEGSEFTIRLAYQNVNAAAAGLPDQPAGPLLPFRGKVMVVDDDPFILRLCSAIFQKHAVGHVCYLSAAEALAAPRDEEISIVLTDVRMPVTGGVELGRLLRGQKDFDAKIIALTAQVLPGEKELLLRQGFDGILMKPFMEADLLRITGMHAAGITHGGSGTAEGAVFDLSAILQMSMNDPELLKDNLRVFTEEATKDLELLQAAPGENNARRLSETAHRLAGKTAQAGAKAIAAELRMIEKELEAGKDPEMYREEILALCNAVKGLIADIGKYREGL